METRTGWERGTEAMEVETEGMSRGAEEREVGMEEREGMEVLVMEMGWE